MFDNDARGTHNECDTKPKERRQRTDPKTVRAAAVDLRNAAANRLFDSKTPKADEETNPGRPR